MQTFISWGAGVVGAYVAFAYGEWSGMLEIFLWAMVIDYLTGCAAAIKTGQGLSSKIGLWGLLKKVLMVVAVMFAHRADLAFGTNFFMTGMVYAWLANELISVAENYGKLGLPLSEHLQPIIAMLKRKQGDVK